MTDILKTDRLTLRELEHSDFDDFYAICSDTILMKYMGDGEPLGAEDVRRWIDVSQNNYKTKGFGASAVIDNTNDDFIGFAGIVYSKQHKFYEIIYCLKQSHWGKGLATELADAILKKGLNDYELPYIYATIDHANTASIRVVEKVGMTYEKTIPEDGIDVDFFVIRAE